MLVCCYSKPNFRSAQKRIMMKFTRHDQRDRKSPGKKIQPTPVAQGRAKLSWEEVCQIRKLFDNGNGLSVPEIRRKHFPYISLVWLYSLCHGESRQHPPGKNPNRPFFINDTS